MTSNVYLEVNVGLFSVEADADRFEFFFEQLALDVALGGVEHHQHQVGRARHGDDLLAATLALRRALDNSGKIEQLDVGTLVLDDTRDARQRRELVRSALALRLGQRAQKRGLHRETILSCIRTWFNGKIAELDWDG